MSELGRLLSEARAVKGLTLADVEKVTRIRQKYLDAFEQAQYTVLPRGAVARGFLRTYARFLGLDPDEMARQYAMESGDISEDVPLVEPGKPRLVDYRPVEVALVEKPNSLGWLRWVIALLLVATLVIAAWWWLNRSGDWQSLWEALFPSDISQIIPETATSTAIPTKAPTVHFATITPPPAPTGLVSAPATPTSDILTLPTPTVRPSPTPTPRPTATPESVPAIALDMKITQQAWVRVIVDGVTVEQAILEAGATRAWDAQQSISILSGNAAGVTLILNSQVLGAMGAQGQVVERAWVVQQGKIAETTPAPATANPAPTARPGTPAQPTRPSPTSTPLG